MALERFEVNSWLVTNPETTLKFDKENLKADVSIVFVSCCLLFVFFLEEAVGMRTIDDIFW